ncbi:MAG TPA: phosphatase PAP2 family protein [Edaphobacter sp.]|nr:phosphatase PAP2 family protein [Edaphobacter sp.]
MRTSEWIQLGFAVVFSIAAWATGLTSRPLPLQRRWIVTALAAFALVAIGLVHACASFLSATQFLVLLDFLTVALFLVPYWQTGQFFLGPNPAMQDRLLAFDRRLIPGIAAKSGTERNSAGFVLEMAYLSCYPLVPLGLAAIYLAGLRGKVDVFWLVLLVSTYLCYAITPFVPAFPPRSLFADPPAASEPAKHANKGRIFNRWILQHGSIHAISFPSAHVASAFAIAFVLLLYAPWIGVIFLVIAILISAGAVVGRYHYALDVLLGAVTSLLVFLASYKYL